MNDESVAERLYLMQVASVPPSGMPFVCYLVQTGGQNILIDTGLPTTFQMPPGRPAPELGKSVVEQLAEIGLQPEAIDTVLITHFDGDHIGQLDKFPDAKLVVQQAQYDAAVDGHQRFAQYRWLWDQPVARYTFVEGDTDVAPGVQLIESSGHVAGHQSVLLHLPKSGAVLLTIDAVPNAAAFTTERDISSANDSTAEVLASTQKLIDLVQKEKASLVIFGHDAEQWQTLKKLPDYYA